MKTFLGSYCALLLLLNLASCGRPQVEQASELTKQNLQVPSNGPDAIGEFLSRSVAKAKVHVHTMSEFDNPTEQTGLPIRLVGRNGRVFEGKSPTTFTDVPLGRYHVEVTFMGLTTTNEVMIVLEESRVTVSVPFPAPYQAFIPMPHLEGNVRPLPRPGVYARLIGLYSSFSQESDVSDSGRFRFVAPYGKYLLVLLRSNRVCKVQEVEMRENKTMTIEGAADCMK